MNKSKKTTKLYRIKSPKSRSKRRMSKRRMSKRPMSKRPMSKRPMSKRPMSKRRKSRSKRRMSKRHMSKRHQNFKYDGLLESFISNLATNQYKKFKINIEKDKDKDFDCNDFCKKIVLKNNSNSDQAKVDKITNCIKECEIKKEQERLMKEAREFQRMNEEKAKEEAEEKAKEEAEEAEEKAKEEAKEKAKEKAKEQDEEKAKEKAKEQDKKKEEDKKKICKQLFDDNEIPKYYDIKFTEKLTKAIDRKKLIKGGKSEEDIEKYKKEIFDSCAKFAKENFNNEKTKCDQFFKEYNIPEYDDSSYTAKLEEIKKENEKNEDFKEKLRICNKVDNRGLKMPVGKFTKKKYTKGEIEEIKNCDKLLKKEYAMPEYDDPLYTKSLKRAIKSNPKDAKKIKKCHSLTEKRFCSGLFKKNNIPEYDDPLYTNSLITAIKSNPKDAENIKKCHSLKDKIFCSDLFEEYGISKYKYDDPSYTNSLEKAIENNPKDAENIKKCDSLEEKIFCSDLFEEYNIPTTYDNETIYTTSLRNAQSKIEKLIKSATSSSKEKYEKDKKNIEKCNSQIEEKFCSDLFNVYNIPTKYDDETMYTTYLTNAESNIEKLIKSATSPSKAKEKYEKDKKNIKKCNFVHLLKKRY
jgi:hypothetical protein